MKHPLQIYLEETGDAAEALARRVGVEPERIGEILDGGRVPDFGLAQRIVLVCAGAVTLADLLGPGAPAEIPGRLGAEPDIDAAAMRQIIGELLAEFLNLEEVSATLLDMACDATANTYAALAGVTALRGPARLAQALRPVLQEILEDYGARQPDPTLVADRVRHAIETALAR